MIKTIPHKEERLEAIQKAAKNRHGVYAKVAREYGWRREYVSRVVLGHSSSSIVMAALEKELGIIPEYLKQVEVAEV